jgi:hypothetical protein
MSENGDAEVVDAPGASKIFEEVSEDRIAGIGRPTGYPHDNGLPFQKRKVC